MLYDIMPMHSLAYVLLCCILLTVIAVFQIVVKKPLLEVALTTFTTGFLL